MIYLCSQEVFELCRPDFITRSRERLKLIALKAEERRIQALHEAERKKLFEINRKKETDPIAHPYSGSLFKIPICYLSVIMMNKLNA